MIIKSTDHNFNYITSQYPARQPGRADTDGTVTGPAFSGNLNKAANASRVDKIEISQGAARLSNNSQFISETKDKIIAEINGDKDEEAVGRIKEQLNVRQYAVSPVEIAKILLTDNNE
ncbi:hypothetical protein [Caproiciproducens sp.]